MQIERVLENYFKEEPLTANQEGICGKYPTGKPHRVISNWQSTGLYSKKLNEIVILDDLELLMNVLTEAEKYSKIWFWNGEDDQRKKAKGVAMQMKNVQVVENRHDLTKAIDWSKAAVGGNMAFTITNEMIDLFHQVKPPSIQQISATDWALAIKDQGGKHGPAIRNRQKLLDLGLKKIIYLPYKFFKQVKVDHKVEEAQIGALYFETELGYNGEIEVVDYSLQKSYFAPRNADGFPRTEFAFKLREIQPKIQLPPLFVWHDFKNQPARNLQYFNDAKLQSNKFYLAIRHYAGGKGIVPDPENGLLSFLQTNKIISRLPTDEKDLKNLNLLDWFIFCFDTPEERDSFKSLCDLPKIQQAMSDMNFKMQRFTTPGLKLLPNFPLDRTWTLDEVEDYVKTNY